MLVDVSFRLLADAPKPLIHNQAVDLFVGASEVPARVRLLGSEQVEPGQEGWLQLRLDRPLAVAAGDRFILRQPSPSSTLGGGLVLNPHPRRRWKRFDPDAIDPVSDSGAWTAGRGAAADVGSKSILQPESI